MKQKLKIKILIHIFISILLLISPLFNHPTIAAPTSWNTEWNYSQLITLPIDTSVSEAIFQPIDTQIQFASPCWAASDHHHSVRICCWDGTNWHELESQIYNLEEKENNIISSCNIVFLIPDFADGTEQYYVFYDDTEKPSPSYTDHVSYKESSYRFEPISGYPLASEHYEIIDDEDINYMISYNGQFMGYNTCQHIFKMIEGTEEILPKNGELFAAFDYKYCYEEGLFGYSSTSQQLISKEVITDGNLMLEIGIVSTSKLNDLKTTATYKYYHCPSREKRIHAHVIHETLTDINVYADAKTDGAYASLQAGGVKSRSIEDLNIGNILPWMHFNNELGAISSYTLDTDPEYIPDDPDIRVISIHDDVDLGSPPWVSFDKVNDRAHAIVFGSNKIVQSGTDEQDGLQINAFQMDYPHLAGLENNIATVQIGRNSIESGSQHDLRIPKDFTVEFDAEFFTSYTEDYSIVEKEAAIFHDLATIKPQSTTQVQDDSSTPKETYDLSVTIHNTPTFPMGSSLSVATGWNLSYINVELYKENEYLYSQNAVRLPLHPMEDVTDPTLFQQIRVLAQMLDLRNISLVKTAVFPNIEEGTYVAKVYKENPFFRNQRQYIGFSIIDVPNSEKTRIFCRQQASVRLTLIDQYEQPITDATIQLKQHQQVIGSSITDSNGTAQIAVPFNKDTLDLTIIYHGYQIYQESMSLSRNTIRKPLQKSITIDRFHLKIAFLDTWDNPPGVDLHPILTIPNKDKEAAIPGEEQSQGIFLFPNLTVDQYRVNVSFKSFSIQKSINVKEDTLVSITFPAEFDVSVKIVDVRGNPIDQSAMILTRLTKQEIYKKIQTEPNVKLPPGEYQVELQHDNQVIGKRMISVFAEKNVEMVTNQQPLYPLIALACGIFIIILSLAHMLYTANRQYFLFILIISFLIISLFLPWWQIQGSSNELDTSTHLSFIPQSMMSIHTTDDTIAGETSYLPDEFHLVITLILIGTGTASALMLIAKYLGTKQMMSKRVNMMLHIISGLILLACVSAFLFALHELTKISIGSILGSATLDIGVPGEQTVYPVQSSWGPAPGFYLFTISTILYLAYTAKIILPSILSRLRRTDDGDQKK